MWRIANSNQILSVAGQSISKNKIQFYFLLYWGTQIFTFVLFSPLQENWTLANKKTVGQPRITPSITSMAQCFAIVQGGGTSFLQLCCCKEKLNSLLALFSTQIFWTSAISFPLICSYPAWMSSARLLEYHIQIRHWTGGCGDSPEVTFRQWVQHGVLSRLSSLKSWLKSTFQFQSCLHCLSTCPVT